MAFKITRKTVEAAQPGPRDEFLWDSELRGFGLKVSPKGRKVFVAQYRVRKTGATRRVTIGALGKLTPEQARVEARRILAEAAVGGDPASELRREAPGGTVAEVLGQFFAEHVAPRRKARTAAEYRRIAELHILPALGARRILDVDRVDVVKLHTSLVDRPYAANRTVALLSKFFNWCEGRGLRPDHSNPCRHVEKYPEQKRERFLSAEEIAKLGKTLDELGQEGQMTPWTLAAVRLLLFTGARLSEILTLKWQWVDLDGARLNLPDSKTGKKTVHLSPMACDVLRGLPRLSGNPFVICGAKPRSHLVNLEKPWRAIRARAGLDGVRLHDLRHSFASIAAASGLSLVMIGKLLGHSQPQTTARYAHLAADPVAEANRLVGERMATALRKTSSTGQTE